MHVQVIRETRITFSPGVTNFWVTSCDGVARCLALTRDQRERIYWIDNADTIQRYNSVLIAARSHAWSIWS